MCPMSVFKVHLAYLRGGEFELGLMDIARHPFDRFMVVKGDIPNRGEEGGGRGYSRLH